MENKRPREDDEFDDSKRQHQDPVVELVGNVTKDIRRIGEGAQINTTVDDISYISNPIVVEFEKIDELRSAVLKTLGAVVLEQPMKVQVVSVLVMICNAKNFLVSKYVIEYFHSKIQDFFHSLDQGTPKGCFNDVKNILKFLCCLSPIIEDGALYNVLQQLLKVSIDLQTSNPPLAQEIYYNTLICLPYVFSNDEITDKYDGLLTLAKEFNSNIPLKSVYTHFDSRSNNFQVPDIYVNLLETILPSIDFPECKKLFIDFKSHMEPIINESLQRNKISSTMVKHALPQFSINLDTLKQHQMNGIDKLWCQPRFFLTIYKQDFPTVPDGKTYSHLFFKDVICDLVHNLEFNRNETAVQLSIFDLYFNSDLFAPPGTPVDRLADIHKDNVSGENIPPLSTWKMEDLIVETFLQLMLTKPLRLPIYYYTVLITCCRNNPDWYAPVFGRAFRFFYKNLEVLNYETRLRFMDWMAVQISNFEFSWKWDEWVEDSKDLAGYSCHPTKSFIKGLISKEVKLSNKKRIKDSFVTLDPQTDSLVHFEEFHQYLNLNLEDSDYIIDFDTKLFAGNEEVNTLVTKLCQEKKDSLTLVTSPQNEMLYIFNDSNIPFYPFFQKFYKFLMGHNRTNEQFFQHWTELNDEITDESLNKSSFLITYLIQTYCHIGNRSIYSTNGILDRDLTKLKWCCGIELQDSDYPKTEEFRFPPNSVSQQQRHVIQNDIIDAIFRIWSHQPQFIFVVLEHLVDSKILDASLLFSKCLDSPKNLLVSNSTCFESLVRVLESVPSKPIVSEVLTKIIEKVSEILTVVNTTQISDSDEIEIKDKKWLIFDYLSLFKYFITNYEFEFNSDIPEPIKEVSKWLDQVNV